MGTPATLEAKVNGMEEKVVEQIDSTVADKTLGNNLNSIPTTYVIEINKLTKGDKSISHYLKLHSANEPEYLYRRMDLYRGGATNDLARELELETTIRQLTNLVEKWEGFKSKALEKAVSKRYKILVKKIGNNLKKIEIYLIMPTGKRVFSYSPREGRAVYTKL